MPRIPTQQWCLSQEDPKKRHQWVFVGGMVYGSTARYTPDDDSLELLSERLEDAGYMHVSELESLAVDGQIPLSALRPQVKKLRLPAMGQHHTLNNTSDWVDMEEPNAVPMVAQDMDAYTTEQNAAHFQQLLDKGFRPPAIPLGPTTAEVVADVFDPHMYAPGNDTPSVVIGVLKGQSEENRRIILAAELRGKRREKILNHPDWRGL